MRMQMINTAPKNKPIKLRVVDGMGSYIAPGVWQWDGYLHLWTNYKTGTRLSAVAVAWCEVSP